MYGPQGSTQREPTLKLQVVLILGYVQHSVRSGSEKSCGQSILNGELKPGSMS